MPKMTTLFRDKLIANGFVLVDSGNVQLMVNTVHDDIPFKDDYDFQIL